MKMHAIILVEKLPNDLHSIPSLFEAKGPLTLHVDRRIFGHRGGNLLSGQPFPGLPAFLERKLERMEDLGGPVLPILADIRRFQSELSTW